MSSRRQQVRSDTGYATLVLMARLIGRIFLAALFMFAAFWHLVDPQLFMPIMPPWIPAPMAGIVISGVAELVGAVALLAPLRDIQRAAGVILLLLLVAVFPANVYMAVAHVQINGFPSKDWMSWARLPLQPILMLIVSWASTIWPPPRGQGTEAETYSP
jgi:uncharacterized membrane protein